MGVGEAVKNGTSDGRTDWKTEKKELFGVQLEVTSLLLEAERRRLILLQNELGNAVILNNNNPNGSSFKAKEETHKELVQAISRIQSQYEQLEQEYKIHALGALRCSNTGKNKRSQPAIGMKIATRYREDAHIRKDPIPRTCRCEIRRVFDTLERTCASRLRGNPRNRPLKEQPFARWVVVLAVTRPARGSWYLSTHCRRKLSPTPSFFHSPDVRNFCRVFLASFRPPVAAIFGRNAGDRLSARAAEATLLLPVFCEPRASVLCGPCILTRGGGKDGTLRQKCPFAILAVLPLAQIFSAGNTSEENGNSAASFLREYSCLLFGWLPTGAPRLADVRDERTMQGLECAGGVASRREFCGLTSWYSRGERGGERDYSGVTDKEKLLGSRSEQTLQFLISLSRVFRETVYNIVRMLITSQSIYGQSAEVDMTSEPCPRLNCSSRWLIMFQVLALNWIVHVPVNLGSSGGEVIRENDPRPVKNAGVARTRPVALVERASCCLEVGLAIITPIFSANKTST
ncbi:unnamed protein product [Notodromas monacha]|uniref:Uncharacterized protein n=1 Tax=Notodromas monacha TaxID=399045 RepID=A0A7R9GDY0_9CRUS|nr:unnamed protein product [Notodromas monacha]CAG0917690.1 unnamed protein product [Notodromas monacha]